MSDAIEASEFNPAITPDTMILPTSLMRILTQRRIADNLETTIFEWVSKNNLLALEGKKLTIRATSRTESTGVGGIRRITVYRRDPACIEMRIPKELEFLALKLMGLIYSHRVITYIKMYGSNVLTAYAIWTFLKLN